MKTVINEMDIKVLTLNCWGIPIVSKDRKTRIQAIAEYLATHPYDFVCLQEVWSTSDFELIRDKVIGALPFSHYFYSGVVGSGICVFSRYQFQEVFFHQWPVNGYVHKLQHGDWFGGKGVGLCKFKVKDFNINVYSAHLHAEYNTNCDEYQAHRILQSFDTTQFIQMTSGSADFVILAGDLNTEPGSLAYRILTQKIGLQDSFGKAKEPSTELSSTNESLQNSYTATALIKKKTPGKRIDYIMFSCSSHVTAEVIDYCHPLPNRVPGHHCSYSDHEAVCATLRISKDNVSCSVINLKDQKTVIRESMEVCETALHRLKTHKHVYWFLSALLLMIVITTIATNAPFEYVVLYHIFRVLLTGLLCFTVVMASLWNGIETNAILAGKLAMEVSLKHIISEEQS